MLIRRIPRCIVPFVLTVALLAAGSSPLLAQRGEADADAAISQTIAALIGKVVAWLGSELRVVTAEHCSTLDPNGCSESRSAPVPDTKPTGQSRLPMESDLPRTR